MGRSRGYSLPLVMMLLAMLGMSVADLTFVAAASTKATGSQLGRRTSLYVCDGIVRGLSVSSRSYFAATPVPTASGLRQHLCGDAGTDEDGARIGATCPPVDGWFPGYTVEQVKVGGGSVNEIGEVPTGPFAGQTARRTDLAITVEMQHTVSGRRCRVAQKMVNSQIGLFQFLVFSSIPMDVFPFPPMTLDGRVHINGDFCAGSQSFNLTIDRLTASGQILAECSLTGALSNSGFLVKDTGGVGQQVRSNNDGDSPGWAASALATWGKKVQDESHGVPSLTLPVVTGGPTQPGTNQGGTAILSNADTLRILVDPPLGSDPADVGGERLANKATIVIINGVWYKKAEGAPLPGTPIWSDHSGTYSTADVADELGVVGTVSVPVVNAAKRYSWYERDAGGAVNNLAEASHSSVVSYGLLHRVSATEWVPGVANPGLVEATTDALRVKGASQPFIDARQAGLPDQGRMLPLNFDLEAFVEALNDPAVAELGGQMGGTFNGVVWIANTWPGHDNGRVTPALSTLANVTATVSGASFSGVAQPLCGVGTADLVVGTAQQSCSAGLPRVNAVRVINAGTIDPAVLPKGLTIATNLPLYTVGNINTGSLVAGVPGDARTISPTGPWVPLMLASDALTVLSTGWTDSGRIMGQGLVNTNPMSCAVGPTAATTVAAAILAGHVQSNSAWGGGINNFPRFVECWRNVDSVIVGSMIIGYRSVYARAPWNNATYFAPDRDWKFDSHFANPAHQPPGTPSFFVQAVERWDRD